MAQKILLVNPIKRKRTAKQKVATKKLIAFNKARSKSPVKSLRGKPAPKKATSTTKRKVNPMAAKRRKARRSAAQRAATKKLIAYNRRGGRKAPAKRRRRNPIRTVSASPRRRRAYRAVSRAGTPVRRRRNPIRRRTMQGMINTMVMPAISAATGAIALDIAWGYLPIPVDIKMGPMKHIAKAAGALALYYAAGMVVREKTAESMGVGALTVVAYQAGREMIDRFMPQVALQMGDYNGNNMGYYSAGLPVGGYGYNNGNNNNGNNNNGMGLYVQNGSQGMGNMNQEYDEMGLYVAQ